MRWCLTQRSSQVVSCRRVSLWRGNNKPSLNRSYKLRAWFHVCLSLYLQTYQTLLSDTQFPLWFSLHFLSCPSQDPAGCWERSVASLSSSLHWKRWSLINTKASDHESAAAQQRMFMQWVDYPWTFGTYTVSHWLKALYGRLVND